MLTRDGRVVTGNHVISGATTITVDFSDRTDVPADVAADLASDLAVLRADRDDLVPLAVRDSDRLTVGEQMATIGNALDLSGEPTRIGRENCPFNDRHLRRLALDHRHGVVEQPTTPIRRGASDTVVCRVPSYPFVTLDHCVTPVLLRTFALRVRSIVGWALGWGGVVTLASGGSRNNG